MSAASSAVSDLDMAPAERDLLDSARGGADAGRPEARRPFRARGAAWPHAGGASRRRRGLRDPAEDRPGPAGWRRRDAARRPDSMARARCRRGHSADRRRHRRPLSDHHAARRDQLGRRLDRRTTNDGDLLCAGSAADLELPKHPGGPGPHPRDHRPDLGCHRQLRFHRSDGAARPRARAPHLWRRAPPPRRAGLGQGSRQPGLQLEPDRVSRRRDQLPRSVDRQKPRWSASTSSSRRQDQALPPGPGRQALQTSSAAAGSRHRPSPRRKRCSRRPNANR